MSRALSTWMTSTPAGSGRLVGPETSVVRAPRLDAAAIGAFLARQERGDLRAPRDARLLTGRADAFAAVDRLLGRLGHREAA